MSGTAAEVSRFISGVKIPERSFRPFFAPLCLRIDASKEVQEMLTVQHLSILHNQDLRPLIQDLSFT